MASRLKAYTYIYIYLKILFSEWCKFYLLRSFFVNGKVYRWSAQSSHWPFLVLISRLDCVEFLVCLVWLAIKDTHMYSLLWQLGRVHRIFFFYANHLLPWVSKIRNMLILSFQRQFFIILLLLIIIIMIIITILSLKAYATYEMKTILLPEII